MNTQEKLNQSKQLFDSIVTKLNEIESTIIKLQTEHALLEKQEQELLDEMKQKYHINTIEEAQQRIAQIEKELDTEIQQYSTILTQLNEVKLNEL